MSQKQRLKKLHRRAVRAQRKKHKNEKDKEASQEGGKKES